jgi:putative ABC transport system permease protein
MENDPAVENVRHMRDHTEIEPPKWAARFLNSFCPDDLFEEIEGDLYQRFNRDVKKSGLQKAQRNYVWSVLRFFRPGIILRNKIKISLIQGYMIRNYLLVAFRNFRKQKSFTLLNIVGLSIGMVASLLILQYVKYERSYDTFHEQADNIYRIQYNGYQGGQLRFECAAAVPAVGPALKDNFGEVKRFTRLFPVSGVVSYESPEHGLISFLEEKMQITDSSIFEIFDFKLLTGNPEQVLAGPNKAVISQKAAKKYFGDLDPIGKTITWNGDRKFEVTGIFQDIPANSHIKFDFMLSYQTLNNMANNQSETSWGWYDFNTYVLLEPGTDVSVLQQKWNAYLEKVRGEDWKKSNRRQEFILQPMKDIHLYANLLQESQPEESGDGDSVYALTFIAIFILVIAWVNYINLATAKSMDRANEVGVRKVMGAEKRQLISQFFAESFLINLFSALIAIAAVRLAWSFFAELSGRNIPIEYLLQKDFWLLLTLLFASGTILSGFYPAIILSSFKPVAVLKGKVMRSSQGSVLRKSLVVFQFVASVILISGSIIVYQQLTFMQQQDLGININQTLVVKGPGVADSTFAEKLKSFKAASLGISGIKGVSASTNVPGDEIFWASGIRRLTAGPETSISGYTVGIDEDYVPAFDLKLSSGRSFDRDHTNEKKSVIINEAMSHALGFDSPDKAPGEKVIHGGDTLEIIGVLTNYHQMSLKEAVSPLVFRYTPGNASFIAFKLDDGQHTGKILSAIEEQWKTFFPGNPVDYFFLDQFFNRQYKSERQFGEIFTLFTILAIFIACLGLFGLASFMTAQRTKEIGIRKVLGSSATHIVLLLSKGFIQLVLIANLIAWPLAWWLMNNWLESFPYRITINPLLFLLSGLGVIAIAFLSVGLQTLKAALINPAKTLKYE